MPHEHTPRFVPKVLELEDRAVPAGNLTVTQLGTELRVIGDAEVNTFTLRGIGPGVVEISGAGTTINGGNAKVTASGVSWLRVAGRAGDDTIKTRALEIARVDLFGEGGNDVMDLAAGTGKVLYALGGSGDDVIRPRDLAVGGVNVYGESGNDTLTTQNLSAASLLVTGGAGDDVIRAADTSNGDRFVSINVNGDEWTPDGSVANGSDTITVTGVRAHGEGAYVSFQGDGWSDDRPGGRDRMTLSDVDLDDVGWFEFDVLADYVPTDPGNEVTFENIRATVVNDNVYLPSYMEGGPGDDTFRLRNVDVDVHGGFDATLEWYVGASWAGGDDTIDVTDTRIASHTDPVEGGFNQTGLGLHADTVRVNNFEFVGGGIFSGGFFGGTYYTGAWVSVTADDVDLRDVTFHTNGFGGLGVETQESWIDGTPHDGTYELTNVSVTSAEGEMGDFYLQAGGGDDVVDLRNSSFETVTVLLGDGDDRLTVTNVAGNTPIPLYPGYGYGIDAGAGNDEVTFQNVTFPTLLVELGDGDDRLDVNACHLGLAAFDLGDGDDTAAVTHNTADSLTVDAGAGFDALTAVGNVAPLMAFDNFEI